MSCLRASVLAYPTARLFVGFDEAVTADHKAIVDAFPGVTFFSVRPHHVGPYVIRQFLINQSGADFIAFQDSDDAPCCRRLEVQLEAVISTGVDIVGCHELRIDDDAGIVQAIRFPTDVNAALNDVSAHVQLFPTTLVRRQALLHAGGFSTRRRYASDREFLLRANFDHRISNVDAFLYVRFRHEGSLTTSPRSAPGSRYRRLFTEIWEKDAAAIRRGEKTIAGSALRPRHFHNKSYYFEELKSCKITVYRPIG
jgi:hypothetical protein